MDGVATMKIKLFNFTKNKEIFLVKKAIKGDKDSLAILIKENKEDLYKIAYSYVKNKEDAIDIMQECSYKAMLYISKLKNPEYFKTWITKIVINCSIDSLKVKSNELYFEDGIESTVEQKSISTDEKLDLHNAIDLLGEKYRTAIILKYFRGMSIKNISDVMDIPQNTVKTYLKRGKESLSKILKEDYLNE